MKRVTIYDVAKEAGVSLATVSRVINGSNVQIYHMDVCDKLKVYSHTLS